MNDIITTSGGGFIGSPIAAGAAIIIILAVCFADKIPAKKDEKGGWTFLAYIIIALGILYTVCNF